VTRQIRVPPGAFTGSVDFVGDQGSEQAEVEVSEAIVERLRGVIDPELGQDIVELGMVGGIEVGGRRAVVTIALTTPSCPLRGQIEHDARVAILSVEGVDELEIKMGVLEPAAKAALMDRARRLAQNEAPTTSIPAAARVLGIASGKGGVGKSSVTVNLAVALARRGAVVGILDADIWGFSIPRLLGLDGPVEAQAQRMVPKRMTVGAGELRVLSMGFLSGEDEAIMWRGLILSRAVQQFIEDAHWDDVDYLLIDLPPGTGDVQMGLARLLPRTELLVVTTPPVAAQKVATRAADMARRGHLRVAGVIENMSSFICEHGETYHLFGSGGGERLARALGVPLLASIPLDGAVAAGGDNGSPIALGSSAISEIFSELAERLATEISPLTDVSGCSARMLDAIEAAVAESPTGPA